MTQPSTPGMLAPLRIPAFRWLSLSQTASLLGDQFYLVALPWLALQLTGSSVALGTVLATAAVPRAIFMLVGGVLTDRFSPRAVLLGSSLGSAVLNAAFVWLVLSATVQLWHLYAFALAVGVVDALAYSAAATLVPQLVSEQHYSAANAIIGIITQATTFVGPALAGLVVAAAGTEAAFVASIGTSLTAVATLAYGMRSARLPALPPVQTATTQADAPNDAASILGDLRDGLAYTWRDPVLRSTTLLFAMMNLTLIGPVVVGGGLLADQRWGGANALGLLLSAWGGGGLLGSLAAGAAGDVAQRGRVLLWLTALIAVGIACLSLPQSLWSTLLIFAAMGLANGWLEVNATTWLQSRTPAWIRGRVFGIMGLAIVGLEPISHALTGWLAAARLDLVFLVAGITLLGTTVWIALSRALHEAPSVDTGS